MNSIIYRNISKKDYYYIKNMMNEQFYLYEYIEDKRVLNSFLNAYLYDCLAEKTFSMVAEKDGKIVGIILGNAKKDYKAQKAFINKLKSMYHISLVAIKSIIYKTNIRQYNGITNIYNQLMKNANKDFDGVLTLFVVDKEYQGNGIGKKLLYYLLEYEKQSKTKNIYLYTDSKCNYKFYDKLGFNKIGEDIFNIKTKNNQFNLTIYLYEYIF